jgi:uncharacterized membrane protein YvlD (DUF360 family)
VFVLFNNAINSDLDFRPRLGFTIVSVLAADVVTDVVTGLVTDVVTDVVTGLATAVVAARLIAVTIVSLITASVALIVTVLSFLERRGFLSFSSVFFESIIEDFLGIFTYYTLNVSFNLNHFNIFILLESLY